MYDQIVIPVDGSDEARHAARRGLELARRFDATAHAIHVVEQNALKLTRRAEEKTNLRERGERVLAQVEELASEFGRPVETELMEGTPVTRISEYADEVNAGLIVVGRQGLTGLGERLLGGVTEHLLSESDVPVLVVPGGAQPTAGEIEYARILLPTDGSKNAERTVRHGAVFAEAYDSIVHVLNVVDLQAAGGAFSAGGLNEEFVERLEAEGRAAVDQVAAKLAESGPIREIFTAVKRTTSFDGSAAGIQEYAEEHDVDLIVMGTHGRSNVKRQLLGSVASTVLRTVDVPVLLVRRPAE